MLAKQKFSKASRGRSRELVRTSDVSEFRLQVTTFIIATVFFLLTALSVLLTALSSHDFYVLSQFPGEHDVYRKDVTFTNKSGFFHKFCQPGPDFAPDEDAEGRGKHHVHDEDERESCAYPMAVYEGFALFFYSVGIGANIVGVVNAVALAFRTFDVDIFKSTNGWRHLSNVEILNVLIICCVVTTYFWTVGTHIVYIFTPTRMKVEKVHVHFLDRRDHTIKVSLGSSFLILFTLPVATGISIFFSMLLTVYHKKMVPINL